MRKSLYILIIIIGFLAIIKPAHAGIILRPVINTGLVGYWDFQEGAGNTAYDKSGNGNHGTWGGTGTSHWVDGKLGKGGNFNGSDDYVSTGGSVGHNIGTGDFAWAAWVYPTSLNPGDYEPFISNSVNYLPGLYTRLSSTANWGMYWTSERPSGSTLSINNWYHLVAIRINGVVKFYQNGVQTLNTYNITDSMANENLEIGRTNYYYDGKIDEVRIYNRALGESEIERLYKLSQPKIGINQLGLVDPQLPANATISYVRENCAGYSPCYNSLSDWESNLGGFGWDGCTPGDLTCLNKTAVAKIDGIWNSPDTVAVNIDGWVTDATRYIKIYTTATARHPGKWDETKYRLEVANIDAIEIYEEYTRISGLQMKLTTSTDYQEVVSSAVDNVNSDIRISNNIIRGVCSAPLNDCTGILNVWNAIGNYKIWNNILYDLNRGIYPNQGATAQIYNNTVVDCNDGYIINGAAIIIAKNNLAYNNTDNYADYGGSRWDDYSTNNLSGPSSDAYTPSANARNGVRVNFVDEANKDFHLSPADSGARNYGTDLSNDASISYPFDIDRQSRTGSWDIGADEARGTIVNSSQINKLTNGLVGYWTFDGTKIDGNEAYDSSGNNNTGTISGATPIDGKVGQGLSFSHAETKYVYIGDSVSLLDLPSTGMTLSFWLKRTDDDTNEMFSKCASSNTNGWSFIIGSSRRVNFTIQRATTDLWVVAGINTIPSYANGWLHLAVTYPGGDEADNVHIYSNGVEVSSYVTQQDGADAYMSDSGLQARIGRGCWNNYTDGEMDEVRLYDRVLSAEEIKRLYNLGR